MATKVLDIDGLRTFFADLLTKFDGRYYKQSQIDSMLGGKSDVGHTHDDRYYTESEIDTKLALKANLASPTFTGTPKAPTPSGSVSDAVATAGYVQSYVSGIGNATQSSAGFMSASDKTRLDQTAIKVYTSTLYSETTNVQIGDQTQCVVFNRYGNYAMVTFDFKLTVVEANVSASTTIISGLPKSSGINPCFVMSTKTGDSVVVGYITTSGNFVTSATMTNGKTYYGTITYRTGNANDWYEFL